jgi:hypothetical protein
MATHRVTSCTCPSCGSPLDSVSNANDNENHAPKEGDITVCFRCGHVLIYQEDGTVRNPTDKEIIEIAGDPDIIRMTNAVARVKKIRERAQRLRDLLSEYKKGSNK